jgi:hypothetical protein
LIVIHIKREDIKTMLLIFAIIIIVCVFSFGIPGGGKITPKIKK